MRLGRWHVVPTDPGSGRGGQIKWRAQPWGVEVESNQWPMVAEPSDSLPADNTQYMRLPWKTLAQMLITREEVAHW